MRFSFPKYLSFSHSIHLIQTQTQITLEINTAKLSKMATSDKRDLAPNNPFTNNSYSNNNNNNNPSATGPTGSSTSSDPVVSTYGNTHSSTRRANPIHPSDPQSTAHPAYGNASFSSPYETAGGNTAQGDGAGGQRGAGVGVSGPGLGQGGHGGLGREYQQNIDGAYGHATGANPPAGYGTGAGGREAGPYDTAGGNAAQAGSGQTSTHMGGSGQATVPSSTGPAPATAGTGTGTGPAAANTYTGSASESRSSTTGSKAEDVAQGVKGLFAAVHGAGESIRGEFNAGVDRSFNEVLEPHPIPFPSLRPLSAYAEEGDGEFPASVYMPSSPVSQHSQGRRRAEKGR